MEEFNLKDITDCKRIDEIRITTSEVNRPGLQLVGYLEYFGSDRIQIIGQGEYEFMKTLGPEEIYRRMDAFFATGFPCLVVARDLNVCPEIIEIAKKYQIPILKTKEVTSRFLSG